MSYSDTGDFGVLASVKLRGVVEYYIVKLFVFYDFYGCEILISEIPRPFRKTHHKLLDQRAINILPRIAKMS